MNEAAYEVIGAVILGLGYMAFIAFIVYRATEKDE